MPYLLSIAFDQFLRRITISGDLRSIATTRRDRIAELLEGNMETLDIFPTGSLVRGTGLKGSSDVDVIALLHYTRHVKGKTPTQVLESVRDALSDYDARIVKRNGQAVTLYFKTWPNVDLVPAKRVKLDNGGREIQIADSNSDTWIPTNPTGHDAKVKKIPLRRRQLIRMAKCWNVAHSSYMQSFHIELAALKTAYATDDESWAEDDWTYSLVEFFEAAEELTDLTGQLCFEYETDDWEELRTRLRRAKALANEAWAAVRNSDYAKAMEKLRVLFGDRFPAYSD
jgi:SMODS domain-containing protein